MFYDIYLYTLCYYICCLLWRMYEMHPALSLKTGCDIIRVDVRAPFVGGRLGAQRHAQKYLRVMCWTWSPGDGVQGLDASLRWDSVTRSLPLVSEMS
jgi:hypothetical protein